MVFRLAWLVPMLLTPVLAQPASVAVREGKVTLSAPVKGAETVLLQGVGYCARTDAGVAFETGAATAGADGTLTCALAGPDAGAASVTARLTALPRGFSLSWRIRYWGPKRAWNGWSSGFRFDFGPPVTGARADPVTKWVRPTGAHPWEVPGDTPYPDTECQVREVLFGDAALVIVSPAYDPDWIYAGNLERTRFSRLAPPPETPSTLAATVTFLAVPVGDLDPARLAAEAAGRPVALSLTTGRTGNLFVPGEPVGFDANVSNVTDRPQRCTLALDAWSYQGEHLLTGETRLVLAPAQRQVVHRELTVRGRGVVFLAGRLAWEGGETLQRATVGILPQRAFTRAPLDSPFAMAAVIASPEVYPDQRDLPTVLSLMQRVGVRRVRSGWFPLKAEVAPAEEARVRAKVALLQQAGILPYAQVGGEVPAPAELEAWKKTFAASLERFRGLCPWVEVGNELNFSTRAADYVDKLLRPVNEVMRRVCPEAKILSMGLGGVTQQWLGEFVHAGGMDLIDVLSVHPGCQPRAPEFWEGWRGWVFRSQVLDALKAAREHGGKEVWLTETYAPTPPGRSGLDLRTSADYLVRSHVCSLALGVKVVAWYQFQDGVWFAQCPKPDDEEYNFGVVYTDLTPKPAYVAFGAMTEQLEGARCLGRLSLGREDLYGVRFQRDGRAVDVLWSYAEKHETDLPWWPPEAYKDKSRRPAEPWVERWRAPVDVTLPADGPVTVTDLMGNSRRLEPNQGKVTLALTGSPVYVTGLGEVPRLPRFWNDLP